MNWKKSILTETRDDFSAFKILTSYAEPTDLHMRWRAQKVNQTVRSLNPKQIGNPEDRCRKTITFCLISG